MAFKYTQDMTCYKKRYGQGLAQSVAVCSLQKTLTTTSGQALSDSNSALIQTAEYIAALSGQGLCQQHIVSFGSEQITAIGNNHAIANFEDFSDLSGQRPIAIMDQTTTIRSRADLLNFQGALIEAVLNALTVDNSDQGNVESRANMNPLGVNVLVPIADGTPPDNSTLTTPFDWVKANELDYLRSD